MHLNFSAETVAQIRRSKNQRALVNPFGVYLMQIYSERAVPEELLDAARFQFEGTEKFTMHAIKALAEYTAQLAADRET